jgi:catalase
MRCRKARASADRDYLMAGVLDLLPIRYRLLAQLAHDDDQTTDPSEPWPDDREWADLGLVEITGKDETREKDGDVLVHDPMRLIDGVEPSTTRSCGSGPTSTPSRSGAAPAAR